MYEWVKAPNRYEAPQQFTIYLLCLVPYIPHHQFVLPLSFFLSLLFSVPPISHTNFSQSEEISQFFETIINSFQFVSCKGSRKFRFLSHQELINVSQDFHLSRVSGAIDFYCSSILLSLSCYSRTQTVNFLVLFPSLACITLLFLIFNWLTLIDLWDERNFLQGVFFHLPERPVDFAIIRFLTCATCKRLLALRATITIVVFQFF